MTTSGLTLTINDTRTNQPHAYDGIDLAPGSDISFSNLGFSDLASADLRGANVENTSFWICNLRDADFSNAVEAPTEFYLSDLTNAKLLNMDLSHTDISFANFNNADLRNVTLKHANGSGTDFTNADLRYADLTLFGANAADSWSGAKLYGAVLPGMNSLGHLLDQAWFEARGADFTTVPEPSSYALLLGGIALWLVALRRR